MADIADLGIRIDSSPATKAAKELDALTVSATKADAAADGLASTSKARLAPGMAAGGQQSRMMAMQLSQVAQQASATGNWVQALAIQLPDMAMGFGAVGIGAGILASVALPALVAILSQGETQVKSFSEALDDIKTAQSGLEASTATLTMSLPELYEQYGLYAFAVRDATRALIEHQAAEAQVQLGKTLIEAAPIVEAYADAIGRGTVAMANELGVTVGKAQELQAVFAKLRDAVTFEDRIAAIREVEQALRQAGINSAQLPAELRKALIEGNQAAIAMAELEKTTKDAKDAADSLSGAGPGAGWLSGAIGDAVALAGALWEAYAAKTALAGAAAVAPGNLARTGDDGRGSQRPTVAGSRTNMPDQPWMNTGGGGGGGGGGGSDPFAENLQALVENLKTQRETEDQWYQENLAILQDRRAQEIIGKQEHDAAMIALHEEYQRRIAEIDAEAQQQRLGDTANLFGALASVAQAGGQRMAKIAATFQAVEGTVNAYGAAIKALNTPGLTLAGRFAAYASVLAAGLKGVMGIRQAGGIGGGSGGRTAAQGATAATVQRSSELTVNVDPNALLTATMWDQIFEGVFGAAKARGMTSFSGIRFA